MIRRIFTVGFAAALALVPLSALAADLTINVERPNTLSWVPREHCRMQGRGAVCTSASHGGMTITVLARKGQCYVDFDNDGARWHLRGTRGKCRARLSGNTLTVS